MSSHYRDELDRAVAFTGVDHRYVARARAAELVHVADRQLGDPRELDVLDAGCGIGLTVPYLRDRFHSLTGTDVSAEALVVADRENPGVRFELAAPGRLPFDDGAFDLSFCMNVVQVIPVDERAAFLSELARVTRAGGLVAVFEHNPYNPLTQIVVRRFDSSASVGMLPMREMKGLLEAAELTPVAQGFILLSPSRRSHAVALERSLRRVPLGAQYYVAARPPAV
ncbi:MAG: class I SAM-dependent methyltransferase [Gaiellaceae bacterium]